MLGSNGSIRTKLLKILVFSGIFIGQAANELGHLCLAQSPSQVPSEYPITLKDLGPLTGFVDSSKKPQLKLVRIGSVWDLKILKTEKRVSEMAIEDYRLSPFRSGEINRILLNDWILTIDPKILLPKAKSDFLDAWRSYRESFIEELARFKDQRKLEGYTNSAELYFSKSLIQQGLLKALEDADLNERLRALVSETLDREFQELPLVLDEKFYSHVNAKEVQSNITGQILIRPRVLPSELKAEFEPHFAKSESIYESVLGQLKLQIPIVGASIKVGSLAVQSDLLPTPYVISEADDLSFEMELNRAQAFEIKITVIWNKITQRPELRFERKDLRTPFESARITSFKFRGKQMDVESDSPTQWVLWNFIEPTMNKPEFMSSILHYSTSKLTEMLTRSLPFQETFVVIQNSDPKSMERYSVDLFQAGFASHDPGLNPNLVARFQLTVPIVIEAPEVNVALRSVSESLAGKIGIRILNPDVELENLELFWKGKRLSSDQVGFRFRMLNREDRVTKLDAIAELSLSNELNFKLDQLSTNLDGLSVRGLDVRLGTKWLAGDRPSLQMILENIDLLRKELTHPKALKGIGERLQAYVENQIRRELSGRLSNLSIPLKLQEQGVKATGEFQIPSIPIQDVTFRLRDWKQLGQVCKGSYLMSAEAYFGLSDSIILVGKRLNVDASWKGLSASLRVASLSASIVPDEKLNLKFAFDLCLSPNRETIDFAMRYGDANLKKFSIHNIQLNGLETSSGFLDAAVKVFGLGSGNQRELKVAQIVGHILETQKESIFAKVGLDQSDFISGKIKSFLDSAPIRGEIERKLIEVGDVEEKVTDLMFDLGKFLKGPLEKIIVENLTKMANAYLPKANESIKAYQSVTDKMLVHIGQIVGDDLEGFLYAKLMQLIYGPQSRSGLMAQISYILEPSKSVENLKKSLGLAASGETQSFAQIKMMTKIIDLVSDCPFSNRDSAWGAWNQVLGSSDLERQQIEDIRSFIHETCDPNSPSNLVGTGSINDISRLFEMGLNAANKMLLDESVRHFFSIPNTESLPLRTSNADFEFPVEVNKIELLPFSNSAEEVFRVVFYSRGFSNKPSFLLGPPASFVQSAMRDSNQNMIFRIHRETLNEILGKVDWSGLLRTQFPTVFGATDTIDMRTEPFLTADGRILFKAFVHSRSGKVRLVVTPLLKILASLFDSQASDNNLNRLVENKDQKSDLPDISMNDIGSFAISFLDLQNPFGFEADMEASIRPKFSLQSTNDLSGKTLKIEFEPLQTQKLDGKVLTTPIKRRLDVIHQPLNRLVGELLSQVGEIPSLQIVSNSLSLDRIELENGDLYIVVRRSDSSNSASR